MLVFQIEKVPDNIDIDFETAHSHLILERTWCGCALSLRQRLEDHGHCSRHDTGLIMGSFFTLHRESLARTCLAISENTNIVAIKSTLDDTLNGAENILLSGAVCEYFVKFELTCNHLIVAQIFLQKFKRI